MKRNLIPAICLLVLMPLDGYAQEAEQHRLAIDKNDTERFHILIDGETFSKLEYDNTDRHYLYPIIGPTGASMTRGFPMIENLPGEAKDHPHHQSLWFAHGGVNQYDFWHAGRKNSGKYTFPRKIGPERLEDGSLLFDFDSDWVVPDGEFFEQIAEANTKIRFAVEKDNTRIIDYSIAIKPETYKTATQPKPLVFADTKEGTMAIRSHPALRLKGKVATGKAINSEGDKDRAVWGKRAKWVAYWGVIDGEYCGFAIFDHPRNLRHPTWWHARDYGLVAANPFGISDFEKKPKGTGNYTLKAGEQLKLQYRFVFFAGTAEEAKIGEKYDQWVKETTAQAKQQTEQE